MKLSIIIPVFNAEKYLKRCLNSLIHQDLSDYEVLVINDGSKDASVEIAKEYSAKYSYVKVISKENGGVGSARNKGIEIARGEYIYFLDPDDYVANFTLKKIITHCDKNNLDILTFGSIRTVSSHLKESKNVNNNSFKVNVLTGQSYVAKNFFQNEVWWYIIRKEFLDKSGIKFIEGRWMEDAIFTASIFMHAKRMANIPIDTHRYVITPKSAMTSKEPEHYLGVIRDNANAAIVYNSIMSSFDENTLYDKTCIKRLKTKQQSFVFFMMVRMLKSTIKLKEIKSILNTLKDVGAYPMHSFVGEDYNKLSYKILVKLFNSKPIFYLTFSIFNPILKKI